MTPIWFGLGLVLLVAVLWVLRAKLQTRNASTGEVNPDGKAPEPAPKDETPHTAEKTNVLEGLTGDVEGRVYFVGKKTVTIGREKTNFIQTTDDEASRTHGRLKPVEDGLLLTDLKSKNGIMVNEMLIEGDQLLKDGDKVRIGQASFVYWRKKEIDVDAGMERKRAASFVKLSTRVASAEEAHSTPLSSSDPPDD